MITCDNGLVKLSGTVIELGSDVASIIHSIKESYIKNGVSLEDTERVINKSVSLGLKDEKEVREEAKQIIMQHDDLLDEFIKFTMEKEGTLYGSSK